MILETFIQELIKWGVPLIGAGVLATIVKPIVTAIATSRKEHEQKDWDLKAADLREEILGTQESIKLMVQKHVEDKSEIENHLSELRKEFAQKTNGVREAILAMHGRNLVVDAKHYVHDNSIGVEELEDFMDRYSVYKKLGGNGHMDTWLEKVKRLPNP